MESSGSAAGGGAIELVAEEGKIVISNELISFKFLTSAVVVKDKTCCL